LENNVVVIDFGNQDGNIEYAVCCQNCGATGPNDISVKLASKMWNLRRIERQEKNRKDSNISYSDFICPNCGSDYCHLLTIIQGITPEGEDVRCQECGTAGMLQEFTP